MAVVALGYAAAGNLFFSDEGKLHTALGAAMVLCNRADYGEYPLAALHLIFFKYFGVDFGGKLIKLGFDRVHFLYLGLFVFLIGFGIILLLLLNRDSLFFHCLVLFVGGLYGL